MDGRINHVPCNEGNDTDDQAIHSILPGTMVMFDDPEGLCFPRKLDVTDVDAAFPGNTFQCSECGNKYSRSTDLLNHLHTHSQSEHASLINHNILNLPRNTQKDDVVDHDSSSGLSLEKLVGMVESGNGSEVYQVVQVTNEGNLAGHLNNNVESGALSIEMVNEEDRVTTVYDDSADADDDQTASGEVNVTEELSASLKTSTYSVNDQSNFSSIVNSCIRQMTVCVKKECENPDGDSTLSKKQPLKNILKSSVIYQCEVCDKVYEKKSNLERHVKTAHSATLRCGECDREFTMSTSLQQHVKRVHGADIHTCHHCLETFLTHADLIRHRKTHKRRPAVSCDQCDENFVYKKDLKTHVREMHKEIPRITNEPPVVISDYVITDEGKPASIFRCNLCSRAFNLKTDLLRHFLVHSGEKPFPCDMCESRFNRRSNLLRHRRSMHNIIDETESFRYRKSDLRQRRYQNKELWQIESEALAEEERIIQEQQMTEKQRQREMRIQEWVNDQQFSDEDCVAIDDEEHEYDDLSSVIMDNEGVPKSGVELSMLQPDEKITVRILTFDS